MRGKLLGYQDVVKIMKMMLRVLLLAAASFFVYILAGGREIPVSAEKLRISLQSDKNGEGCYLFLPSFARLPDVTVLMPFYQAYLISQFLYLSFQYRFQSKMTGCDQLKYFHTISVYFL